MNKIIVCIMAASLIFAANANAQTRPVWLLGHGLNSGGGAITKVLNYGGNGAEIDVRTDGNSTQYNHWSLGHSVYYKPSRCDGKRNWSLKQFIENEPGLKDERFCLLWIDVKSEKYLMGLITYLHQLTPNGTPYSIIYNVEHIYSTTPHFDWINKNLRDNECLNYGDCSLSDIQKQVGNNIKPSMHFFTRGLWVTRCIPYDGDRGSDITRALALSKEGQFCTRAGIWSCNTGYEAYSWLHNIRKPHIPTECDVVLTYSPGGFAGPFCRKDSLEKCMNIFKSRGKSDGMHMATRQDSFVRK